MLVEEKYRGYLRKEYGKYVSIKDDRIISKLAYVDNDSKIVIPSSLFPLVGQGDIKIFTPYNTEKLEDEQIREIYDNTEYKRGNCYGNTKRLMDNLIEAGIKDFKTYVGWFYLITNDFPVHHSVVVYKDKYMLDASSDSAYEDFKTLGQLKGMQLRNALVARNLLRMKELKNSERSCFGYMMPGSMFIARELDPTEGAKFYVELRSMYPNHPAFYHTNQNGII